MKRFLLLVGALFLLASCTDELDQIVNGSRSDKARQTTVFQASVEECGMPETKVYADENMKVLWNEGDQITIFNKITYNHGFEFDGEDGDTAGGFAQFTEVSSFTTWADLPYVYAVYPYDSKTKINNSGVMTVTLPSEQTYKEKSFGIGANTMAAVSENYFLGFKNVGGYLSLRLYGDDISVSRITIQGNNGEKIAGKAKIEIPLGGLPTTTMDNTATDEISIVCDPAVKIGEDANNYTDFWFVIPPVTFTKGFTITVTDDKGGVFEKSTSKSFTVTRNTLDWMSALKVVPNYDNVIIQFEDANFKAYCVEKFDTDHDGEISMAEANVVTTIGVNTGTVASLKGIEYFKNLQFLTCRLENWSEERTIDGVIHYYNEEGEELFSLLSSLDVSGNTALTHLDCSANHLTSLDISKNTALQYLYCGWNQLTSLDLSNNAALTQLYCHANHLTSLDVSNNTALSDLWCGENQLTNLDVSYNDALSVFECSSNQLTSLDMSNNTALTGLFCYNNQLTSLDVSKNTALTDLRCHSNKLTSLDVSHNPVLTNLGCSDNTLTSLDISHNPLLVDINCNSNQIESLNVGNNAKLTHLSCAINQITELNVSNNTVLTYLHCFNNNLSILDLSNNTTLTELNCKSNPSLTEIWLKTGQTIATFNYDTDIATIKYKDLSGSEIISFEDANFKAYCVENFDEDGDSEISYSEASIVTIINCTKKAIKSLSGIEFFTNLTKLWCDNNQLTSLDVSNCTALTDLYCDVNQLTNLDVSKNSALKTLNCGANQLTSLNVSHNMELTTLRCNNNQLTSLDVSNCTALDSFFCYSNQLTSLDVSNNTALYWLSCSSNQLTSLDVSHNTELGRLYCSYNQLTSLDVSNKRVLERLSCEHNPSLTEIWLKTGQTIQYFSYDTDVATIKYKD